MVGIYRVSHETWQLVNGFECFLPYIILDIEDFIQFISLTHTFTQIYFTLKSIFYKMTSMLYFLLFSFVSKNLTNYRRRPLKLLTNCYVFGTPCSLRAVLLLILRDLKSLHKSGKIPIYILLIKGYETWSNTTNIYSWTQIFGNIERIYKCRLDYYTKDSAIVF